MMDFLVEGWERRTQQKIAFAGCVAALLTLRNNALRTGPKLREFADKLIGYGSAALLFSGSQETCRAVRGRHDALNSAISGAVTGGLVVGYYQGPKYRLLGVVTWGLACSALHFANDTLRPRYILEDYLIREGLLSPHVAQMREGRREQGQGEDEVARAAQQDVLLASLGIRERELRQLNERLAAEAATGAAAGKPVVLGHTRSAGPQYVSGTTADFDVPDDDPGYQAWLRVSGLEAEALLQPSSSPSVPESSGSGRGGGAAGSGPGSEAGQKTGSGANRLEVGRPGKAGFGAEAEVGRNGRQSGKDTGSGAATPSKPDDEGEAGSKRSWANWLQPWRWRTAKSVGGSQDGRHS